MASAQLLRISCLFLVIKMNPVAPEISDICVNCLCEAISGGAVCPATGTCHDGVCGPFAITFPYWQDAGRPTVGLDDRSKYQTYEKCALDFDCSRFTIKGYMRKFHQDCNGDGSENCWDFAQIHYHGGYGCNKTLSVPARNTLIDCLQDARPQGTTPPYRPWGVDNQDTNELSTPTTEPAPDIDIRFGD